MNDAISGAAGHPSEHDEREQLLSAGDLGPPQYVVAAIYAAVVPPSSASLLTELLPEGWSLDDEAMGLDACLVCPCGTVIEQDGTCPEGHVSPLRSMGLI